MSRRQITEFGAVGDGQTVNTTAIQKAIEEVSSQGGGCDEGPSYWGHAAGSLFMIAELLHDRSDGKINIFTEPKFHNMWTTIDGMRLDNHWFALFADTKPGIHLPAERLRRIGWRINNQSLIETGQRSQTHFVHSYLHEQNTQLPTFLRTLFWRHEVSETGASTKRHMHMWWPSTQVMIARETQEENVGLTLATKAGNNSESHNHNDCGHFIVHLDGQPAIIDLGIGHYSKQNFSQHRYDLWYVSGGGHNAPVINGHEQIAGTGWGYVPPSDETNSKPHTTHVSCTNDDNNSILHMDLAHCYSAQAQLTHLRRSVHLERGEHTHISVFDHMQNKSEAISATITLLSPQIVEMVDQNLVAIKCDQRWLQLRFNHLVWQCHLEAIELHDTNLIAAWGTHITAIRLTTTTSLAKSGSLESHLRLQAAATPDHQ